MKKILTILFTLFFLVGCTNNKEAFTIQGDKEYIITNNDITSLSPIETTVIEKTQVASNEVAVTGSDLKTILENKSIDINTINSMTLVASDGYEVTLDNEMITNNQILVVYQKNGQELDKDTMPAWIVVVDQPAKYWVKSLSSITIK